MARMVRFITYQSYHYGKSMRLGKLIRVELTPVIVGIIEDEEAEDYVGRSLQIRIGDIIVDFSIVRKKRD